MTPSKKVTGKERTNFYYSLAYHFLEDIQNFENFAINLPNQNSSRKRKRQYCEFCDYSKRKRTKKNCALCKKPTCESHFQTICPKCFDT